jgi:Xaa-Pro aminopeptidase
MKIHPQLYINRTQPNKQLPDTSEIKSLAFSGIQTTEASQALGNYGKYIAFKGKIEPLKEVKPENSSQILKARLDKLRKEIKKEGLDMLIVRSTDEYLNETVNKNQSQRIYISGFTGSAGDVVVTGDKAHLIVDGRYHTQADKEVDPGLFTVEKVGIEKDGKEINEYPLQRMVRVLTEASKNSDKPLAVGYDPNKFSVAGMQVLINTLEKTGAKVEFKPTDNNLVDKIRGGKPDDTDVNPVRQIPDMLSGEPAKNKLNRLRETMNSNDVDVMVISNLVDIAYLTNLRGKDIDCSSVFKSKAIITSDKTYVFCNPEKISKETKNTLKDIVIFKPEDQLDETIKQIVNKDKKLTIAFPITTTTVATHNYLKEAAKDKAELKPMVDNPIAKMRAVKNDIELATMQDAMNRADRAVADVIEWVNKSIEKGEKVTEKDLEEKMLEAHLKHGANGLSFNTIPASGSNGAIIHYSKGDPAKLITAGELVLLDTGGYYDGGYATDLTRTWLAGGEYGVQKLEKENPEDLKRKREVYNTVLTAALRGLTAELPPDADGVFLDKLVSGYIKEKGFPVKHSTGHGIGIVVHESPPSISSHESGKNVLLENMVFSIEPGIYLENDNLGGVRIENLVTVVKHSDPEKAKEGWHEIKCLTFAPLDDNLIDRDFIGDERLINWLEGYFKPKVEETMAVKD